MCAFLFAQALANFPCWIYICCREPSKWYGRESHPAPFKVSWFRGFNSCTFFVPTSATTSTRHTLDYGIRTMRNGRGEQAVSQYVNEKTLGGWPGQELSPLVPLMFQKSPCQLVAGANQIVKYEKKCCAVGGLAPPCALCGLRGIMGTQNHGSPFQTLTAKVKCGWDCL